MNRPGMRLVAGSAVVAALVAGYALGSKDDSLPAAGQASQPARVTDIGTSAAPSEPTAAAQPAGMGRQAFWQLTDAARNEAGNDTARQSELVEQRLSRLPGDQILQFHRIRRGLDERAYTWDLWGAAYVIEDGCSDDCFRDFRAYLISLGRGPYEAALRDPDSLAGVAQDAEHGDWENADDVSPDAYSSATGEDFPGDDSDLSGDPSGEPWDDEQAETLTQRYPALAARFR